MIIKTHPGRQRNHDRLSLRARLDPLVVSHSEPSLSQPLSPQPLLRREASLVEPAAIWGTEKRLRLRGSEIEGEDSSVQAPVGAEEVSYDAVVGAKSDRGRGFVPGDRILNDLFDREARRTTVFEGVGICARHFFVVTRRPRSLQALLLV